jgi:hypothetical protein
MAPFVEKRTTVRGHVIVAWRTTEDGREEALIAGHG